MDLGLEVELELGLCSEGLRFGGVGAGPGIVLRFGSEFGAGAVIGFWHSCGLALGLGRSEAEKKFGVGVGLHFEKGW